jgi:hypothetical protein
MGTWLSIENGRLNAVPESTFLPRLAGEVQASANAHTCASVLAKASTYSQKTNTQSVGPVLAFNVGGPGMFRQVLPTIHMRV